MVPTHQVEKCGLSEMNANALLFGSTNFIEKKNGDVGLWVKVKKIWPLVLEKERIQVMLSIFSIKMHNYRENLKFVYGDNSMDKFLLWDGLKDYISHPIKFSNLDVLKFYINL